MKKNNKKGFTLAELLIVIAIIAILVAIAIPVFTKSLDDAKASVMNANERAIKAMATVDYLEDNTLDQKTYYVDAAGDISTTVPTSGEYYKCDVTEPSANGDVDVTITLVGD